ncbi:MAG: serine hydrolase [Alphaproteobacteria bacterium]|jgi:beta-lactamase class A|nr:serine hydrolase [Alphaproteobacteria bacterium]
MRRFAWLVWILALVAQPAWAEAPARLQPLEQRLAALATENPGDYGFAALDLATGEMVSFNGDQSFPLASTMKIAVAAAYLDEVEAGRRSLDDSVGGVSAYRLMDAMITRSDNRATDQLMSMIGGPSVVDQWLRRYGIAGIRVDRTIAQLLADRRDLRDVRDSSTPVAMLNLLRLIDRGDALQPQSRALLLDMMARCRTGSNRIRGLLPPGTHVENKTGTLNGYTGDVGFLTLPDGTRVAVAFFARYGENRPAVIATAARAIYDSFAPGHGPGPGRATMAVARRQAFQDAPQPDR